MGSEEEKTVPKVSEAASIGGAILDCNPFPNAYREVVC
jgi:hypothetical protein